jgi:hypothetical protein
MGHSPTYYRIRSFVRVVFWATLASVTTIAVVTLGERFGGDIPDCEEYHYPCETTTTIYDPYGYETYRPND